MEREGKEERESEVTGAEIQTVQDVGVQLQSAVKSLKAGGARLFSEGFVAGFEYTPDLVF